MLKVLLISLIIWAIITFISRVLGKSLSTGELFDYELLGKMPKRITNISIVWFLSSIECVICLIVFIIKL